jgi:ribose transport system permease protein
MTSNRMPVGRFLMDQMPVIVLLALCTFAAITAPRFLSSSNLTNVLLQASVLTVVTLGMTYVIIGGGFDLSVGAIVALSGCVAVEVMIHAGFVAGVASGALVGLINGFVIARLKVSPFITTLGTMVLVRGVVLLATQGAPVVNDNEVPLFVELGTGRWLGMPVLVWLTGLLCFVLGWVLHKTAYGTRVFAVGGNREAAFLSGVPVSTITISTFTLCGMTAGIAGVMLAARLQSGQPTAGEFYDLTSIAAVVIGGAALHGGEGRIYKSIVGVLIMTVLTNSLNLIGVDSYWQRIAIGLVIIVAAAADQFRHKRN